MVLPYGDTRIAFDVRRQPGRRRQSVAVHVEPNGCVLVDAPVTANDAEIRTALSKRLRWVHDRLQEIHERRKHVLVREYVSGESVYYLGRRYRLKVLPNTEEPAVRLRGGYLQVAVGSRNPDAVRFALEDWYREQARRVLGERLLEVCQQLPWVRKQLPSTALRTMYARWGSCSPQGRLTLNPALVRAPRECIDYVLIHELCHLKRHDHSRHFYRLLDAYVPSWQRIKHRLDGLAEKIAL
ncbi:M48 family peptidase [Dyella dinghuensis]|uniref:M48 family peptidase n=2 Tax=Dyella dinghuensis TaxID=1920169 RepID=A0A432LT80_9GAMM|nr:M48 family peptidase [Dyella dinghuensis]